MTSVISVVMGRRSVGLISEWQGSLYNHLQPGLSEDLLGLHVVTAGFALLVGLGAMVARKRQGLHTTIGQVYFWTVSVVSVSGAVLAIVDWDRNAPFFAIAVLTQSFASLGWGLLLGIHQGRPPKRL